MDGVIVINKPKDFTSFDVVAVMRGVAHERKAGHTGTLDPMATGVLPLLFGNATKAQSLLPDSNKEYLAEFQFGFTTDTLDVTGKTTATFDVNVTKADIESILDKFRGNIFQIPPMYSAVQKDGKRLYDLARQGIEVEREKRPVTIYKLELECYDESTKKGKLTIACSKGTYIRSLIDDIGKELNSGAIMTDLCRTTACGFTLDDAITLQQAKQLANEGNLQSVLHNVENLFLDYGQCKVTKAQAIRFSNGGELDINRMYLPNGREDKTIYRVSCTQKGFIGLGIINAEKEELKILKLFNIDRSSK